MICKMLLSTQAVSLGVFLLCTPVFGGVLDTWSPPDSLDHHTWDVTYREDGLDLLPYTEALDRDKALTLLADTLPAMQHGLDFMRDHVRDLNLDGVIGTRLVEGQLEKLLNHMERDHYPNISNDVNTLIRDIISKAIDVSDLGASFVKITQPEYYKRIGDIIQKGFWTLDYPSRDVDLSLITEPRFPDEAMREKDSDDCITELLGTSGNQKCEISPHCWYQMTSPGYRYYSLSHEVFYLQIGEIVGCFQGSFLQVTDQLVSRFCANMLKEAEEIVDTDFADKREDLFMEQQALCGMAGFRDFFRQEWLENILNWQWKQGCWGETRVYPDEDLSARNKREEKVLEGGCESHRTAVALGALAEYVRFLVEFLSKEMVHPS